MKAMYRKAAKAVLKEAKYHFKHDGWPLDFGALVEDIFYKAHGHHLEAYLLEHIFKKSSKLKLSIKKGNLVVVKSKK